MKTTTHTNTKWAKHIYTCGHWNLQYSLVAEESQAGGYPIGQRHNADCASCKG